MYIYINYYYCNVNSITIDVYLINLLTYYVSSIMYYINIVIDYNKRYILIIILITYNITKTEHNYVSTKTFFRNCTLYLPQECVHQFYVHDRAHKTVTCRTKNAACYILWQHRSILFVSHEKHRLGVRGNMDTPMRERRICVSVG